MSIGLLLLNEVRISWKIADYTETLGTTFWDLGTLGTVFKKGTLRDHVSGSPVICAVFHRFVVILLFILLNCSSTTNLPYLADLCCRLCRPMLDQFFEFSRNSYFWTYSALPLNPSTVTKICTKFHLFCMHFFLDTSSQPLRRSVVAPKSTSSPLPYLIPLDTLLLTCSLYG